MGLIIPCKLIVTPMYMKTESCSRLNPQNYRLNPKINGSPHPQHTHNIANLEFLEREREDLYTKKEGKKEKTEIFAVDLCLPVEAENGIVESGEGEAYARVSSEGVDGGLSEKILDGLHEQVEAPDRRHVQRQRHRRERHREEQL